MQLFRLYRLNDNQEASNVELSIQIGNKKKKVRKIEFEI